MKRFTPILPTQPHLYLTPQYLRSSRNADKEVHTPTASSIALALHVAIPALILQHRRSNSRPHCRLSRTYTDEEVHAPTAGSIALIKELIPPLWTQSLSRRHSHPRCRLRRAYDEVHAPTVDAVAFT